MISLVVTEVHLTPIKPTNGLVALARVVLNDVLALDSIGVHKKMSGGYRLTYPMKNGRYLFHPIEKGWGNVLEQAIYDEMSKLKVVNYDRYSSNHASSGSV